MVRWVLMALCLAVGVGGCAKDSDTPSDAATTSTNTVPQDASDSYCRAADLLTAAPSQPPSEASNTFKSAAEDLDRAREQITGTERADLAVKSSLGALVSTVRSAAIATSTADDAGRRKHEASIKTRLSEHSADCA